MTEQRPKRLGQRLLGILAWTILLLWALWSVLAILLTGGRGSEIGWIRTALAALFGAATLAALIRLPPRAALGTVAAGCAVTLLWWLMNRPSNDREWSPDQRRLAWAEIDGPLVTVHDIRNFRYRSASDWDEDWYDAVFDTREIEGIYFILAPFSTFKRGAHAMVSFRFAGERFLAVSVEVRKEVGEGFGLLRGMFRQFEVMYVVGDERDLIQLRSNHRGEQVYVHPGTAPPEKIADLFLDMMARVNELNERPEFYHTLLNNCTTNLIGHWQHAHHRKMPRDSRRVLNGYADELAFDLGLIDTDVGFEETRRRNLINDRALEAAGREDFSVRIRQRSNYE